MSQTKTDAKPQKPLISFDTLITQALEIAECARAAGKYEDAVTALEFIASMQRMGLYAETDCP